MQIEVLPVWFRNSGFKRCPLPHYFLKHISATTQFFFLFPIFCVCVEEREVMTRPFGDMSEWQVPSFSVKTSMADYITVSFTKLQSWDEEGWVAEEVR